MLISNDLVPYMVAAIYVSRSVVDHAAGILDMAWGTHPISRGWSLYPFWLTVFPEKQDIFNAIPYSLIQIIKLQTRL